MRLSEIERSPLFGRRFLQDGRVTAFIADEERKVIGLMMEGDGHHHARLHICGSGHDMDSVGGREMEDINLNLLAGFSCFYVNMNINLLLRIS